MTVKLAVLKSGEDVIADIREMTVGDEDTPKEKQKVIGYYFIKPCGVTLKNKAIDVNETADGSYELKLFPWCPLAKNDAIPMNTDWVVTIVDPVDKVKQMYETEVLKDGTSKGASTDEQTDSSKSD